MAARSDLHAGSAFVRIFAKTSDLAHGLVAAEDRLRQFADVAGMVGAALETVRRKADELTASISNFGRRMSFAGLAISGAGITIGTALAGAVAQFASFGESLAKMADRTGIGVQSLSELSYAAEVAGTSVSELELGIRSMQSKIADKGLGLRGLPPEQQIEILADRFTELATAEERTAFAQEMFGRSGTRMLPLLAGGAAGIRQLREEAVRFGRSISEQDARNAEKLKDAWQSLVRAIRGVSVAIGAAFAESLTRILQRAAEIVGTFGRWIRENEALAKAMAVVAGALVAIGAAVTAAGVGLSLFVKAALVLFGLAKVVGIVLLIAKGLTAFAAPIAAFVSLVSGAITASGVLAGIVTAVGAAASALFPPLAIAAAILTGIAATVAIVSAGVVLAGIAFWKLADPLKAIMPLVLSIGRSIGNVVKLLMQGEFKKAADGIVDAIREAMLLGAAAIYEMIKTVLQRLPDFIRGVFSGGAGIIKSAIAVMRRAIIELWPAVTASFELFFQLAKDVFLQLPQLAAYSAGLIVKEFATAFSGLFQWLVEQMIATISQMGASLVGLGSTLLEAMVTGSPLGMKKWSELAMSALKGQALALGAFTAGLVGAEPAFGLSKDTLAAYERVLGQLDRSGARGGSQGGSQSMSSAALGSAFVTYSATALASSGGMMSDRILRVAEGSDKKLGEIVEHVFEGAKSTTRLADGMRMK